MKYILGVNVGHDAGVALLCDDLLIEAINEERFSRQKGHRGIPYLSVNYIKEKYKISNFDKVVTVSANGKYKTALFSIDKNINLRKRRKQKYFASVLFYKIGLTELYDEVRGFYKYFRGFILHRKISLILGELFPGTPIINLNHHDSHAWTALAFTDDRDGRFIITLDGEGDGESGSISSFQNNKLVRLATTDKKSSLGILYSKVTQLLAMRENEHEFKVMGMAPYARQGSDREPLEYFRKILRVNRKTLSLSSNFDMKFAHLDMLVQNFLNYRFDELALAIQNFTEETVLELLSETINTYDCKKISVSGGVFMNIKMNQRLLETLDLEDFQVTPSCGDESLAIGAAYYGFHATNGFTPRRINDLYLGTEYNNNDIFKCISSIQNQKVSITFFDENLKIEKEIARLLSVGEIVARFNGRMEWGARGLGNRSILANPSIFGIVQKINDSIKCRDFWMPFAPSILLEDSVKYLYNERGYFSPYMALGFHTKLSEQSSMQAAIHPSDKTCRPQMVSYENNSKYYNLIKYFKEITGESVILNTSFNLHGEPIVESPLDAVKTFINSDLKYLAIGDYLLTKVDQVLSGEYQ
ncbi:MAG: hypothetical protein RL538_83 [Candidatus Parcubacteria bacterium]|jgi:carbamoyltransferase